MRPYEVEIFDRSMGFIDHTLIETPKYSEDYLDPENNSIEIPDSVIVAEDFYIRVIRGNDERFGVIKTIKKKKDMNTVSFRTFMSLLDRDILLDTDTQTGTLEEFLKKTITDVFISNADSFQNIFGLEFITNSSTAEWELGIEPDTDDGHYAKLGLFDDIILPAFQGYQVQIDFKPDIMNKKIIGTIGVNTADTIVIEADIPSVIDQTVTIKKVKKEINKDNISNSKDYSSNVIYYLHTSGSFDTEKDTDRMTPVSESIDTVSTNNATKCKETTIKSLDSNAITIKQHNDDNPLEDTDKAEISAAVTELNKYLSLGLLVNTDGRATDSTGTVITDVTSIQTSITTYSTSTQADTDAAEFAQSLFIAKAHAKAESNFAKNKYENLIEIEVLNNDTLVNPDTLNTGQKVKIIHNNIEYDSILSGRNVSDTTTLIFGLIRLELTKQLKGRA